MQTIDIRDFEKIQILSGTILSVELVKNARKPAYKIQVDLGEKLGVKKSSAQLTELYRPEELLGRQVVCITNLPPRQITDFMSEVLITGFPDEQGRVALTQIDRPVPNGSRMY